jgi:hypothetical protein
MKRAESIGFLSSSPYITTTNNTSNKYSQKSTSKLQNRINNEIKSLSKPKPQSKDLSTSFNFLTADSNNNNDIKSYHNKNKQAKNPSIYEYEYGNHTLSSPLKSTINFSETPQRYRSSVKDKIATFK